MKNLRNALAVLVGILASGTAFAQDGYGAPGGSPNDAYPDDDIRQTVARLAYVSGNVSFARGDDPDQWQPANPNIPMTLGDRVWTAGGISELQVHGGNVIRLAKATDLTALNLTEDTQQFSVSAGVASFQIRRLGDDDVFEVDTPNAAITFERTGDYRIDVREGGETRIQVRRGRAMIASGGGQVPLGAGDAILIEGQEPPRYDMIAVSAPDGWDRWVANRVARYSNVRSYQYVSTDIAGVEDLDRYGSWRQVPDYGWCWTPTSVASGWQPYRAGRWIWQDPWGWTWVSTERWGWAPYHYGRWVTWRSGWYWVPVAPRAEVVAYSPALVAFVGGGPGFSVSVGVGTTDYVGWFPLAPREPLNPWWGRPAVNVNVTNVTNVTYVNRTYVTVVNQQTFVSSRSVTNNYVRDQAIVSRVERAPVVHGAVPIIPTNESIRVASRRASAPRPPTAAASKSVVTRSAPPPAPPRFDQKVAVIRENRGRPVTAAEATTLTTRENRSPQPVRAVRPAAAEAGRVTLAPKTEKSGAPKPEPVVPNRGRALATKEQPVAPARETSSPARPQVQQRPQPVDQPETRERPDATPVRPQVQQRPQPVDQPETRERPGATPVRPQVQQRPQPVDQPETREIPGATPVRPQVQQRPQPVDQPETRERPGATPVRPQVQQRPQPGDQPETRERPGATPVRPPLQGGTQNEERSPEVSPRAATDRRPPAQPTARPSQFEPKSQPPGREHSTNRPAAAQPAQTSERHAAPRPTPREAEPNQPAHSQSRAVTPHGAQQPAERIAPQPRQGRPTPVPRAVSPDRGREPAPSPAPTKTPKNDEKKNDR